MRRGRCAANGGGAALVATVLSVVLTVAGCGSAPQVGDGVLGVDWAAMPEPVVAVPEPDGCRYGGGATRVDWDLWMFTQSLRYPCDGTHQTETYHVGRFSTGEVASRPEVGDDLFREAYEECAERADEFLGGDHRTARVAIVPVMPTQPQWDGDARWYRCEMLETATLDARIVSRAGSLRDGLRGKRPLAITCANWKLAAQRRVQEVTFTPCAKAHDIELTGIYTARDRPYPGDDEAREQASAACFGIGARYLAMTAARLSAEGGITWYASGGGEAAWSVGDRSYRCFMGAYPRRKLTGSIKGRSPGSFP